MRSKRQLLTAALFLFLVSFCILLLIQVVNLRGSIPASSIEYVDVPELSTFDEDAVYMRLAQEQRNLPAYFWYDQVKKQGKPLRYNESCAPMPELIALQFVNINWQLLTLRDSRFQLHAAYLDNRRENPLGSVVRIISVVSLEREEDEKLVFPDVHCQIWSNGSEQPVITKVFADDYLWREYWGKPQRGGFHPYMLTCILPEEYKHIPEAVSLVGEPCHTATNLLAVTYQHDQERQAGATPRNPRICACVKGVSEIEDKSFQLVEWLEWLKLQRLDHVHLTLYNVPSNMQRVLDHYARTGYLTYAKMYLSGTDPNAPYLQHLFERSASYNRQFDMISYNDCLLRNMYNYDFVIPLELDEIVMTSANTSIQRILNTAPHDKDVHVMERIPFVQELVSLNRQSSSIPRHLTYMQSVYRLKSNEPPSIRCLFSTRSMLMIHNHYPLMALREKINTHDITQNAAYVEQHLDKCPKSSVDECRRQQWFDARKWDFKDAMMTNVGRVLKELQLR